MLESDFIHYRYTYSTEIPISTDSIHNFHNISGAFFSLPHFFFFNNTEHVFLIYIYAANIYIYIIIRQKFAAP